MVKNTDEYVGKYDNIDNMIMKLNKYIISSDKIKDFEKMKIHVLIETLNDGSGDYSWIKSYIDLLSEYGVHKKNIKIWIQNELFNNNNIYQHKIKIKNNIDILINIINDEKKISEHIDTFFMKSLLLIIYFTRHIEKNFYNTRCTFKTCESLILVVYCLYIILNYYVDKYEINLNKISFKEKILTENKNIIAFIKNNIGDTLLQSDIEYLNDIDNVYK